MIFNNTSNILKVSIRKGFFFIASSVMAALLLLNTALAQQPPTRDTRDKGITSERKATKSQSEERIPILPAKIPCAGANYTTSTFNNSWIMGGPVVGIEWTPTATVTISRVEIFTGESTAPMGLAIWSDGGGKPLANLGDTGYFSATVTNSWQGADLLTPVSVSASTKYWVVFDPAGGEQAPVQNGTGQPYWGSYSGTITGVQSSNWFGPFSFPDHAWKFRMFCCTRPPTGMVAWYPFDEPSSVPSASDLIHSNNGVHSGGPISTPSWVSNGLSFDGVNDYVQSPHQPWLNMGTGNFSIDCWIKTTVNSSVVSVILDKRQNNPYRGYHFYLYNGSLGLELADGSGSLGYTNFNWNVNVATNNWNFVAVTVDRTDPNGIKFYLNGVQGTSQNPTVRPGSLDNTVPLTIGMRSFSPPGYFQGMIDELEIFNRVLTPVEIRTLYNAGAAGKCKKC